jgi:hypothetical protein
MGLLSAQLHDEGQRVKVFDGVFFRGIEVKRWEPGGRQRAAIEPLSVGSSLMHSRECSVGQ